MSNKAQKRGLVPKLRFPEFLEAGAWKTEMLGAVATISTEKVGDQTCIPMSITSGVGLVSQQDKFGRIIAGSSYKNYLRLKQNDFAYNKSATKEYPEGYLALYSGEALAAVPNSIFTCFRINGNSSVPKYLDYLFHCNLHGKWLRKFIQVGARAHGSLSINDSDLLALPVPLPDGSLSLTEQQKIADCLASLDERITLEAQKLDTLKTHKKGLMQQLFPAEGETLPKLRFPEFRDAGEWESKLMVEVYSFKGNNSLSRDKLNYESGSIKNIHYGDIHTKFSTLFDISKETVPYINASESQESFKAENYCVEGDMVFADASEDLADIGKCIEIVRLNGERVVSGLHTILARQSAVRLVIGFGGYLFKSHAIRKQIQKESQGAKVLGLSGGRFAKITIPFPSDKAEQQKIADCLTSLDDLITAQTQKLTALKTHKKGLMQQLFPSVGGVAGEA